jgi:hypothetical protein
MLGEAFESLGNDRYSQTSILFVLRSIDKIRGSTL